MRFCFTNTFKQSKAINALAAIAVHICSQLALQMHEEHTADLHLPLAVGDFLSRSIIAQTTENLKAICA